MNDETTVAEVLDEFDRDLQPITDADLEAAMESGESRWLPTTEEEFQWALSKRSKARSEAERIEMLRNHQLGLLKAKFDRRIDAATREAAFFEQMLAAVLEASGEQKVKTVAGTVYTQRSETFAWPDDDALVAWSRTIGHDEFVRVKETPDKTAIKKYVKETGDAPEGLELSLSYPVRFREA